MALGTPTDGGAAYSATNGTSVAPVYPAGIAANDVLLLVVGQKPNAANGGTVTTPTGWTLREELTGAGGYGATLGADTGNTNLRIYSKDTVAGTETGTLTVTIGANSVSWAVIVRIPTAGVGATFTYGSADGSRTTAPTSGTAFTTLLTNGATAPALQSGDMAVWAMCIPTDVNLNWASLPTISSTGTTFGTAVELEEPNNGNGNDIGGYVAYALATAGTSAVAPTVGVTGTGTMTNVRGPIALVRVRETLPARTGTMVATETGADTLAGTGVVVVDGDLAATETGSDTLAASGTVTNAAVTGTLAATETGADAAAIAGQVLVAGTLAATETGADVLAATGTVAWPTITGTLAASESGADTFTATGAVEIRGSVSATESGSDTFAAAGTVGFATSTGSLAAIESGADACSASGTVEVQGTLTATELGADASTVSGQVAIAASASVAFSLSAVASGAVVGQLIGEASPAVALVSTATGTVAVRASVDPSIALALGVNAASTVASTGTAAGSLTLLANATGGVLAAGVATGAAGLTLTASAVAETPVRALAGLVLAAQATGTLPIASAATCALTLQTSASASVELRAQGVGALAVQTQSAATVSVQAQAAAALQLVGAAISTTPAPVVASDQSRRRVTVQGAAWASRVSALNDSAPRVGVTTNHAGPTVALSQVLTTPRLRVQRATITPSSL